MMTDEAEKSTCICFKKVNAAKTPIIWVIGSPGSDRHTYCSYLSDKYGFTHLAIGELLRENKGKIQYSASLAGDAVLNLLEKVMLAECDEAKGFLLDGFPREIKQSIAFAKRIGNPTIILYFASTPEHLKQCIMMQAGPNACNHTVNNQIQGFLDRIDPVLKMYPKKVRRINATKSRFEVFNALTKILDPIAESAEEWRLADEGNAMDY